MTALDRATSGAREHSAATDLFDVSVARHAGGTCLPPHSHARVTATVVLHGEYEERLGAAAHSVPPLGLIIKPAGAVHANRVGPGGALSLVIELPDRTSELVADESSLLDRATLVAVAPAAELILQIVSALVHVTPERDLTLEALISEWLGAARRSPHVSAKAPPWLARVRERLDAVECGTPKLRELAREAGRHPVYLARAFRRQYGQSIGACARQARIARAAKAIAGKRNPTLSRIALETGYADHSHLAHEFRKRTGFTPSAWRRVVAG